MRKITSICLLVSFAILSITGFLLMFHVRFDILGINSKALHEAISYIFVLAGMTHLYLNRKALINHLKLSLSSK